MLLFFLGMVFGGLGLICLALCQVQKQDTNTGEVYFAASVVVSGIKVYLDRNGVWNSFSIKDTLIASSVTELNGRYAKITGEEINKDVNIEKISVDVKHVQSFS